MSARVVLAAVLWIGGLAIAQGREAPADERPRWRPDATFLQVGGGSSNETWTVGAQWDWRRLWEFGESWQLTGRWSLAAGRLRALSSWHNDDDAWYTKVGFVPTVRLTNQRHGHWYLELGAGPTLLMPVYVSRERTFSTVFNFENRIAAGVLLGGHGQHDLSISVDHISNADIEQPNPGLNQYSIRYTLRL